MSLRLYNTLSSQKEVLRLGEPDHVRMYVCGPTVYDLSHLGHGRSAIVYDVLARHLRASGLRVTYVRNITDIDDKILKRAGELGEAPAALAERYALAYHEDMARLGNLRPDIEPKVTEHLPQILGLIDRLLQAGVAYVAGGDVYFAVQRFAGYGKLSHRQMADLQDGASGRVDEEETARKRHPADFALWKGDETAGFAWDSPWGRGRPGWHIECSAMCIHYLGDSFDLHGGGLDLMFPHHENEIAQCEAVTGVPLATHWVHNGFVEVDKAKMSKSLGNFFTLRDVFEHCEAEAVRYAMLTVHYRSPLALEWRLDAEGQVQGFPQFEEAERRVEYLYRSRRRLAALPPQRVSDDPPQIRSAGATILLGFPAAVSAALEDDLNTPLALSAAAGFLNAVNELCDLAAIKGPPIPSSYVEAAHRGFEVCADSLGLGTSPGAEWLQRVRDRRARRLGVDPALVEAKLMDRAAARAASDYSTADAIRRELLELGVELSDAAAHTTWSIP